MTIREDFRHPVSYIVRPESSPAEERQPEADPCSAPNASQPVPNPSFIVADEPVAGLDASVRGEILALRLRDEMNPEASVIDMALRGPSPTGSRSSTSAESSRGARSSRS
ncbi:hypothetical protein L0U85_08265 [Glycomyces sp. L485]|nr:hypothetical protein [Glycomyces sp. L485]MCH7230842.1 hypothetical protein [Glycomyces sp. L485]